MDDSTRDALIQFLGEGMSAICEEAYCGGWVAGVEYVVPELCRRAIASGQSQTADRWQLGIVQARAFAFIAEQVGSWVNYDIASDRFVSFHPFPIPQGYIEELDGPRKSFIQRI